MKTIFAVLVAAIITGCASAPRTRFVGYRYPAAPKSKNQQDLNRDMAACRYNIARTRATATPQPRFQMADPPMTSVGASFDNLVSAYSPSIDYDSMFVDCMGAKGWEPVYEPVQ